MAKRLSTMIRDELLNYTNDSLQFRIMIAKMNLAPKVAKDIEQFVPYDTGNLNSSVKIPATGESIEYTADYAEYVYNMPQSNNFKTDVHANATSHWSDVATMFYKDFWYDEFKRMVISGHG